MWLHKAVTGHAPRLAGSTLSRTKTVLTPRGGDWPVPRIQDTARASLQLTRACVHGGCSDKEPTSRFCRGLSLPLQSLERGFRRARIPRRSLRLGRTGGPPSLGITAAGWVAMAPFCAPVQTGEVPLGYRHDRSIEIDHFIQGLHVRPVHGQVMGDGGKIRLIGKDPVDVVHDDGPLVEIGRQHLHVSGAAGDARIQLLVHEPLHAFFHLVP